MSIENPLHTDEHLREQHLKLFDAALTRELNIGQIPIVLNGGALIALLTFLGNSDDVLIQNRLLIAASLWVVGVALGAVSAFLAYKSQFHFLKALRRKADSKDFESGSHDSKGHCYRNWAEILVLIAVATFLIGSIIALFGLVIGE